MNERLWVIICFLSISCFRKSFSWICSELKIWIFLTIFQFWWKIKQISIFNRSQVLRLIGNHKNSMATHIVYNTQPNTTILNVVISQFNVSSLRFFVWLLITISFILSSFFSSKFTVYRIWFETHKLLVPYALWKISEQHHVTIWIEHLDHFESFDILWHIHFKPKVNTEIINNATNKSMDFILRYEFFHKYFS